ncbi:MAG: hypothetical protein E6L04_02080 [Thaumarchaeota archaeon]|nr:MAG: hypothetical protein E6L04_02080 [Nitrososphaerota archaeon]
MDEENGVEQTIEASNLRFYKAFESLSIEKMEEVWKHSNDVICIHPGWEMFSSWTCLENIDSNIEDGNSIRMGVIATNIFEKQNVNSNKYDNQWLMIHHQGSSVANYMPPNVSA